MFDGQILIREPAKDTVVYSPWIPREADYVRLTSEYLAGGGTLLVQAYTKNEEDPGNGTIISGASISQSGAGVMTEEWGDLKELVRLSFTVGTSSGDWVLFRLLQPVWFDAVDA